MHCLISVNSESIDECQQYPSALYIHICVAPFYWIATRLLSVTNGILVRKFNFPCYTTNVFPYFIGQHFKTEITFRVTLVTNPNLNAKIL